MCLGYHEAPIEGTEQLSPKEKRGKTLHFGVLRGRCGVVSGTLALPFVAWGVGIIALPAECDDTHLPRLGEGYSC